MKCTFCRDLPFGETSVVNVAVAVVESTFVNIIHSVNLIALAGYQTLSDLFCLTLPPVYKLLMLPVRRESSSLRLLDRSGYIPESKQAK